MLRRTKPADRSSALPARAGAGPVLRRRGDTGSSRWTAARSRAGPTAAPLFTCSSTAPAMSAARSRAAGDARLRGRLDRRARRGVPGSLPRHSARRWPAHIRRVCVDAVEAEVDARRPARSISCYAPHDLDLRITEAILKRGDFGYLGLIGSKTKRQRFIRRFEQRGIAAESIARMTCPIGVAGHRRQGAGGDRDRGGGAAAAATDQRWVTASSLALGHFLQTVFSARAGLQRVERARCRRAPVRRCPRRAVPRPRP